MSYCSGQHVADVDFQKAGKHLGVWSCSNIVRFTNATAKTGRHSDLRQCRNKVEVAPRDRKEEENGISEAVRCKFKHETCAPTKLPQNGRKGSHQPDVIR